MTIMLTPRRLLICTMIATITVTLNNCLSNPANAQRYRYGNLTETCQGELLGRGFVCQEYFSNGDPVWYAIIVNGGGSYTRVDVSIYPNGDVWFAANTDINNYYWAVISTSTNRILRESYSGAAQDMFYHHADDFDYIIDAM